MVTSTLPDSTLHGVETERADRVGAWARRVVLAVLVAVLVAGLTGFLGTRTAERIAHEDGWTLRLTYASVARAGLDVPFEVTVHRDGGFVGPVTLAVTGDYLDIFETQGFTPEPSAATRDGDLLRLEFDPPAGDTLVVAYDAYVQPSSQRGARGTIGIEDRGDLLARVSFHTRLLP